MKMQLIQPFISAADCVLATALNGPTKIGDLSMEQDDYRKKGVAACIAMCGDIEGRIIIDMMPETAAHIAAVLNGNDVRARDPVVRETVHELANMMIGNAVTLLNDHGYRFKVFPPEEHSDAEPLRGSPDTEEMAIYFDTACGRIFLNVRMRYNVRARADMPVNSF